MSKIIGKWDELTLPEGERLLWEGQPSWRGLALRVFHLPLITTYFVLLFAGRTLAGVLSGQPLEAALAGGTGVFVPAAIVLPVLAVLALLYCRTTRYSLTSRRMLLQFGAVLPMTLNLPLAQIARADLKVYRDGSGDLPLGVNSEQRLSYLLLWPHVRPWRLNKVEPMLRSVPNARHVAELLGQALAEASPVPAQATPPAAAESDPIAAAIPSAA